MSIRTVSVFSDKQHLFKELFVGTLIYVVVLGFFSDYTDIVYTRSFSALFLAAIVLQLLTYATLLLKIQIVRWLKDKQGHAYRALLFFSVWLVMFLSKFVFIWAIDLTFGKAVNIYGFFGVLWLVLSMTIVHKAADMIFLKLGRS